MVALLFSMLAPLLSGPAVATSPSCGPAATSPSTSVSSAAVKGSATARVGGVALDQAAKFLADMTEITGAYYDEGLDRIVFVGKKNTTAPNFNRDDLAVAIKTVIFAGQIPWVSLEGTNPDPAYVDAVYSEGLENTRFGQVLIEADYQLKHYVHGYDMNSQKLVSAVPGYQSVGDRFFEKNPTVFENNSRFWITPKLIELTLDESTDSFVFANAQMQVKTEQLQPDNDPAWNQASQEFAQHFTDNYDAFAQERPILQDAKQLGQMAAVVKWIADTGIVTDFYWARDYAPAKVITQKSYKKLPPHTYTYPDGSGFILEGGADLFTANTYVADTAGEPAELKSAAQVVSTAKEDVHWTFTKDGQSYEAVAIAADAFRSLGSYNTTSVDMAFPTAGDLALAHQRTYSSFSGGQYGNGRGWNIYPAALYNSDPLHYFPCVNGTHPVKISFVSQSGGLESFTMTDCNTGYVPDDPAYHSTVVRNTNGAFTVKLKDQTEVTFAADMKLTAVKDKNGNTISYNYDGSGKLTTIADSKGHQLTLTYNDNNLISTLSDWAGRQVRYTYDENDNLVTVTDPNNQVTTYTYDARFKLTTINNREGHTILTNTYTDEAKVATQKDVANITTTFTYDHANRIISATDSTGRMQKITYDQKARVLEQTDPLLQAVNYTYSTEFAPLTITDKRGNTITNTYDSKGNLTSTTYPDLKKVSYTYDSNNRITKITDERYGATPKVTTFTYDANGNLVQTNEAGVQSSFTYDTAGELLTMTDPLNHKITWMRDTFGNKLTETDAKLNATKFEYDAIARLIKTTDPDNKMSTYTYDNNGNTLTVTDAVGVTSYVYDKENRLVKTTLPNGAVTQFSYNPAGSLTGVTDALTNLTSYGYDTYQNLTTQTNALLHVTAREYDLLNREIKEATAMGNISQWEYDANGNITKRIDANDQTTLYEYDPLNRLIKGIYPDGKTITFEYDNRGNRTKMVDPAGTSLFTYDQFDRLTSYTDPFNKKLSYTYDGAGNLTKVTYPNNLSVQYAYYENDLLKSVTDWNSKATTYTYNKNGTVATRLYPNGIKTTYLYDAANRLTEISHTRSTSLLAKFSYTRDKVGNITQAIESGSFISSTPKTTTFAYDVLGRLTSAVYPGTSNNNYAYSYDTVGNRAVKTVNGVVTNYTYDKDNRLTQFNGEYQTRTLTYDKNGNMLTKKPESLQPDHQFTYNIENRLMKYVTPAGNTYEYKYDGIGNRIERLFESSNLRRYVSDISGPYPRLIARHGSTGYIGDMYVYAGSQLLSEGDDTYTLRSYYLEDGTGNPRFTTTYSGGKKYTILLDPYGVNRASSFNTVFGFHFAEADVIDDYYYFRARHYDPELGRFMSKDPVRGSINNPQTQNPYPYSLNNPINLKDPSGLWALGGCISGNLGVGAFGSCAACVVFASDRELGIVLSAGGGGSTGLATGIGLEGFASNADNLEQLKGVDIFVGGSFEVVSADSSFSANDPRIKTVTGGISIGPDYTPPLLPGEFHGGASNSWTFSLLKF
jgi:RHS repeat-associated protein